MKKLIMAVVVMAMVITGALSVSAAEVERERNMDAETFTARRTAQIETALQAGQITEDQAEALLAHINDVVATEAYGNGPSNGEGNEDCVLEDGPIGLFRNENSGMRNGNGNGVGTKSQDGSGLGNGNKSNGGNGQGNGNKGNGGNGQGLGYQSNEDCVLTD